MKKKIRSVTFQNKLGKQSLEKNEEILRMFFILIGVTERQFNVICLLTPFSFSRDVTSVEALGWLLLAIVLTIVSTIRMICKNTCCQIMASICF